MLQTLAPATTDWPKVDGATTEWQSESIDSIRLRLEARGQVEVQARTDIRSEVYLSVEDDELGDSAILQLSATEARTLAAHLLKVADFVEAGAQ
jgi:hypothetical protein